VLVDRRWPEDRGSGHAEFFRVIGGWLREHFGDRSSLLGVGHRVVHGGVDYAAPVRVDPAVLAKLEALCPLAPLHQPHNLAGIRAVAAVQPDLPQVACFDTAFHRGHPELADWFALPRRFYDEGIRRYGFHGLSYEYIASVLPEVAPEIAKGRVVVAHLGSGASMCALTAGRSIDSTMGFTALDGLPMGTRCGALDPGVVFYMLREMKLGAEEAERLLYTKCGLLGVSGVSNDMRALRAQAPTNPDARRAIDLFVYRITREIGSLIAALGGVDGLVFTAGIGENDVATRSEVLAALAWAGFRLDEDANGRGGPQVTSGPGPKAWVIPTNEELVIARQMRDVLALTPARPVEMEVV
jgi:acetate kinase